MVIVGSSAAKYWWGDWREPSDTDVWSYTSIDPALWGVRVDSHFLPENVLDMIQTHDSYAIPDALYTIKLSHLGWDNHAWEKHKRDALEMERRGCKIVEPLFSALVNHWKKELGNKDFLSLSQSKEDFFTDNVKYEVDHDYLHDLVSQPKPPIYTEVLKEGQDVLVDKKKFDNLPFEKQVRMFREEMTVIAVERWVLPSRGRISWVKAYPWAVRKTITSLTKDWATEFIVRNLRYFVVPDYSYFKNVLEEFNMTNKVDLTPFEKLLELGVEPEDYEGEGELSALVYHLCEGEVQISDEVINVKYPSRDGRKFNDPTFNAECQAYWDAVTAKKEEILNAVGGYEHLHQEGGGEGGSEYCFGVFRLGDKIYRAEYSYYSYDGHHYYGILDTLKVVERKQKTITVYE